MTHPEPNSPQRLNQEIQEMMLQGISLDSTLADPVIDYLLAEQKKKSDSPDLEGLIPLYENLYEKERALEESNSEPPRGNLSQFRNKLKLHSLKLIQQQKDKLTYSHLPTPNSLGQDFTLPSVGLPEAVHYDELTENYLECVADLRFLAQNEHLWTPEIEDSLEKTRNSLSKALGEWLNFRKGLQELEDGAKSPEVVDQINSLEVLFKENSQWQHNELHQAVMEKFPTDSALTWLGIAALCEDYPKESIALMSRAKNWMALQLLTHKSPSQQHELRWQASLCLGLGAPCQAELKLTQHWLKEKLNNLCGWDKANNLWDENQAEIEGLVSAQALEVSQGKVSDEADFRRRVLSKIDDQPSTPSDKVVAMESLVEMGTEVAMAEEGLSDLQEPIAQAIMDKGLGKVNIPKNIKLKDHEGPKSKTKHKVREASPTIWTTTIWPFIQQNLVLVLAPTFIFFGILLLLFSLWDQQPAVRYALAPATLVAAAWALHRIALWLKNQKLPSSVPVALLQGVSVLLAPMSFLMVALLSSDFEINTSLRVGGSIALSAALLGSWRWLFKSIALSSHKESASRYCRNLLIINALVLLLPLTRFGGLEGSVISDFWMRSLLVSGFYGGFAWLLFDLRSVFYKVMDDKILQQKVIPLFYTLTSLGTFALVWTLTHIRLEALPEVHTYGPLLIMLAALLGMLEQRLKSLQESASQFKSMAYMAIFLIILGNALSLSQPYVRSLALFLSAGVCLLQGKRRQDSLHSEIAMALFSLATASLSLLPWFSPVTFPYLMLAISLVWGGLSCRQSSLLLKAAASKVYFPILTLSLLTSLIGQYHLADPTLPWGIAFLAMGLQAGYFASKKDSLFQLHAALSMICLSLPYLGFANINAHSLQGNTMTFALSLVGLVWLGLCTKSQQNLIKDSRSTVLWALGMMALSLMISSIFSGDGKGAEGLQQQFIILGPLLMSAIMLMAAYFAQSYLPVIASLVIIILIFPEIKDHYSIVMKSGLGSSCSALGFLLLTTFLSRWSFLTREPKGDLIWRQKEFPLRAKGAALFVKPLLAAALFLVLRVISWSYPTITIASPIGEVGEKTLLALMLGGCSLHWLARSYSRPILIPLGQIALSVGAIHGSILMIGWHSLAWALPLVWLLCEAPLKAYLVLGKTQPEERGSHLQSGLRYVYITVSLFAIYPLYSLDLWTTPLSTWGCLLSLTIPSLLALKIGWRKTNKVLLYAAFLLLWQVMALAVTGGDPCYLLLEEESLFPLGTALLIGGLSLLNFYWERRFELTRYRWLTSLLPCLALICLVASTRNILNLINISSIYSTIHSVELALWAFSLFIIGRFLNLSALWLISLGILSILIYGLPDSLKALPLASLSVALAGLSSLISKYPILSQPRYPFLGEKTSSVRPLFLLPASSLALSIVVILLSFRQVPEVMTIESCLALLPLLISAYFAAPCLTMNRATTVALAWLVLLLGVFFSLNDYYPVSVWFGSIKTPHVIMVALSSFLLSTALFNRFISIKSPSFHLLRSLSAFLIILLAVLTYLATRQVEGLPWPRLLTTGTVCLLAALHFRFMVPDEKKSQTYALFTCGITMSMMSFAFLFLEYILGKEASPETAFRLLAIPPAFFFLRSEKNHFQNQIVQSSRNSALVLLLILLGFYVYQPLLKFMMFPDLDLSILHYSIHALVPLLVGFALLRLHALGTDLNWCIPGLISVNAGLFFLISRALNWSFLQDTGKISLLASGFSLLLLLLLHLPSPVRKGLQALGRFNNDQWAVLLRVNDLFCALACHILFLQSLLKDSPHYQYNLISLALFCFVVGHFRKRTFFFHLALIEIAIVVTTITGTLWPSLLFYLALFVAERFYWHKFFPKREGFFQLWILIATVLVLGVLWGESYSKSIRGFTMGLLWLGALAVPLGVKESLGRMVRILGSLILYLPSLMFFLIGGLSQWGNIPRSLLIIAATTAFIQFKGQEAASWFTWRSKKRLHLLDAALSFLNGKYARSLLTLQLIVSLAVLAFQVAMIQEVFGIPSYAFRSLYILHIGLIAYWGFMARKSGQIMPTLITQTLLGVLVEALLHHSITHFAFEQSDALRMFTWTAIAFGATAMEPFMQKSERGVLLPIRFSLIALPLITAGYAFAYPGAREHLPLVIMLYSVLFSWKAASTKDRFSLGYAFIGYTACLLMYFSRHQIFNIQAYLTPCCITLLILVQVFRDRTSQFTANLVRGAVLFALMGHALYEAIIHNIHSPLPHLIVLGVSCLLLAVAAGFRIRIFAFTGLLCLLSDLLALLVLVISNMDESGLRLILGLVLTLGGGLLLSSYILYRKHKDFVDKLTLSLKTRFKSWE
ncbi:MAG: hypothetical protein HQL32_00735 [Planctomycetes bacterium]|nr:hypothetical protein [Planctomycetota bacterium]